MFVIEYGQHLDFGVQFDIKKQEGLTADIVEKMFINNLLMKGIKVTTYNDYYQLTITVNILNCSNTTERVLKIMATENLLLYGVGVKSNPTNADVIRRELVRNYEIKLKKYDGKIVPSALKSEIKAKIKMFEETDIDKLPFTYYGMGLNKTLPELLERKFLSGWCKRGESGIYIWVKLSDIEYLRLEVNDERNRISVIKVTSIHTRGERIIWKV